MFTRHVFDRLAAYAERQLDEPGTARVEAHLHECERCRAALEEIRRGITLASELEPVAMPDDVAGRIRSEILRATPREASSYGWLRAAAAIVLVLGGVAAYWQVNRPWARLVEGGSPPNEFERDGRALHDLLKTGELRLTYTTADELDAWRWLRSQRAPVTGIRPDRSPRDKLRFVPVGATVRELAGARTSVIAYRIDGQPVTLMLALAGDVPDAPSPGWWSKRVTHRRDARGANTLTWTVGGGTYVLVSELSGYGQQACFICHTEEKFQRPIMGLNSE